MAPTSSKDDTSLRYSYNSVTTEDGGQEYGCFDTSTGEHIPIAGRQRLPAHIRDEVGKARGGLVWSNDEPIRDESAEEQQTSEVKFHSSAPANEAVSKSRSKSMV